MTWTYNGQPFTEDMIGSNVAFVYVIDCLANNKRYIGKKLFTKAKTKQVKGKKKKIRGASNWESYYGSNDKIKEDLEKYGPSMFRREILHLCKSKAWASYNETWEIFNRNALIDPHYYNDWVMVRVRRAHLLGKVDKTPKV